MIEIFGKTNCAFCERSKMLCDMKGVDYVYKTLDVDYTREELLGMLEIAPRSFPVIFSDGKFIGGFEQLKAQVG